MLEKPIRPLDAAEAAPPPTDVTVRKRRNPVTLALRIVLGIILLIFLAWLILFITKGRFLKHTFERMASSSMQRDVKVAGDFWLYLNPINVRFRAEGLTISNPKWATKPNFFDSKLIDSSIAIIPMIFFPKNRINRLLLENGNLDLEWDNAGARNTWTFGDPNAKGKPLEMPIIRRAAIAGTTLRYRDPKMQLLTDIKFDTIRATGTRFADNIRFNGTGTLRNRTFTLTGGLMSPNETVAGGKNQFALHAVAARDTLDVSGALPGATVIEGADLTVKVRGSNLANLFNFLGVVTPDTRSYRFTSHLTKAGEEWRFTRLSGAFGQSDLAGAMTISMPNDRLLVDADLKSNSVDIVDVGPFIGYDPNLLAAKGAAGTVTQVNGTPRLLPDAPLRAEALSAFDAHVNYAVRDIRAPNLPVSNIKLTLDLDRSLLKLSPLAMDISGGHLDSDILINARRKPVFTDYDIRLAPTPLGKLFKGFGLEESGTTGVIKARVKMTGSGDTVHDSLSTSNGRIAVILPKGTMWTRNIQLSELDIGTFVTKMFAKKLEKPVQMNCGLIAFTVRDGIAAADPILIDTDKNVITGKGSFSFKDESLDMALRADGKKFSLFSGQSPVALNGHFASPGINPISPQLMTRAGAGVALGLVGTPLAAVLAFVDVGDAKSAACGPVLSGASASAQLTTKGEPRKDVGNGTRKK